MKLLSLFMSLLVYSISSLALDLSPINKDIHLEQKVNYSYELPLNIYVTTEQLGHLNRLMGDLDYAQKRYDKCGIKLEVNAVYEVKNAAQLNDWETFWFINNDHLTDYEKSFFSSTDPEQVNILLVDNLNMTAEGQGPWGAGYGRFLTDLLSNQQEKNFFTQRGTGNIVIGNYRSLSTLAHEIGHAAFELTHTYDKKNLMSNYMTFDPIQFIDGVAQIPTKMELSQQQCDSAINNSYFLKPLFLNTNTLADALGQGEVKIDGKSVDREACVMRLLYENNAYRIEYDYMGDRDITGLLDRFDFAGAKMISHNHLESELNLKGGSQLAKNICGGTSSFSGKKIIESKDVKTSEVRIEGICSTDKASVSRSMSFTCQVK